VVATRRLAINIFNVDANAASPRRARASLRELEARLVVMVRVYPVTGITGPLRFVARFVGAFRRARQARTPVTGEG